MKDYSDKPTETPLQKCSDCDREFDQDNDSYGYDKEDNMICEGCLESHWESPTILYEFDPNEESMAVFHYSYTLNRCYDTENYEEQEGAPSCIKGAKWTSIDGWRGYVDVEINEGYTLVADGWSTDRYDDVRWKWDFNDFVDKIQNGELVPPTMLFFIFSQTSNVFSTSSQIVVKSQEEDTFLNWLADEAGLTREELQDALR